MNIILAPIEEGYIERKVRDGYYKTKTDAIEDAIRRMREAEEQRGAVYAAVLRAEEDVAAGRLTPYTPGMVEGLRQSAIQRAARSDQPSADVTA